MNLQLRGRIFAVALLGVAIVLNGAPAEQMFSQARPAMGTTFTIFVYSENQERASEYFEIAFDEIERVEEALSDYRPTSELSRINRLAANETVTTDPEVFRFLQTSVDLRAFDNSSGVG